MKYREIVEFCSQNDVPDYFYRLDDSGTDEVVGIYKRGLWVVYSASRGTKIQLLKTSDEEEAVDRFIYYLSKQLEAYGHKPLVLEF